MGKKNHIFLIKHFAEHILNIFAPLIKYCEKTGSVNKQNHEIGDQIKFGKKLTTHNAMTSILMTAPCAFYRKNFESQLNNMSNLLPVGKSVINMETGISRERTKYDNFSFSLNCKYEGIDYDTPNVDKFMNDIMLGNGEIVNFLQTFLGYSCTGMVREQKICIFYGNGANGKGVLMNLLNYIFGEYFSQCTKDIIIQTGKTNSAGGASPHVMQLMGKHQRCNRYISPKWGKRLAFVDENDENEEINESLIKTLTGGAQITGRYLYSDYVTFDPTFQIFLLTNHKPKINANESMRRRLIMIPFLAEFKSKQELDKLSKSEKSKKKYKLKDVDIENKLKAHSSEFLTWIIKGSANYFKNGLKVPPIIEKATEQYFKENDYVQNMLDKFCEKDENGFVYYKELYQIYKSEYEDISRNKFSSLMKKKGYETYHKRDGNCYKGLSLKTENESESNSDDSCEYTYEYTYESNSDDSCEYTYESELESELSLSKSN